MFLCVTEVLTNITQIYAFSEHPVREFELREIIILEVDSKFY
jgi:hypothetical protein